MSLSPCGINCVECPLAESCGGSCQTLQGKPFYLKDFGVEVCPIYDCAVNKNGFSTCGECAELPCQIFFDWRDPSTSEEAHRQWVEDQTKILKAL